jgi:mono/diheme cytochrome c family protein
MTTVWHCLLTLVLVVAGTTAGCAPRAAPAFTPRAELKSLSARQQQQVGDALVKYFGLPSYPKFSEVAAADKQPADAAEPLLVEKLDRLHLQHGRDVYKRQCLGCHGVTGDGQGPAAPYLDPPPRDYRLGKFKFTSTPRGAKPRREDLVRVIRRGAKGTSMPTFRWMAEDDLQAVIDYVVMLSSRGELESRLHTFVEQNLEEADDLLPTDVAEQAQFVANAWASADERIVRPLTPEPARTPESVTAGARAFVQLNCYKCHGRDGRGNKEFNVGKDDWGRTAFAADLTTGTLHGGRRPVDIYRRIYSGINATPMPAFAQPDTAQGETEQQRSDTIWNLTHFVTSIVEGRPLPLDVIDAEVAEQLKTQTAAP